MQELTDEQRVKKVWRGVQLWPPSPYCSGWRVARNGGAEGWIVIGYGHDASPAWADAASKLPASPVAALEEDSSWIADKIGSSMLSPAVADAAMMCQSTQEFAGTEYRCVLRKDHGGAHRAKGSHAEHSWPVDASVAGGGEPAKRVEPTSDPLFPKCRRKLYRVRKPSSSPLNDEQFDAIRAGDWYCECHSNGRGNTQFAYFWDREVLPVAQADPVSPGEASKDEFFKELISRAESAEARERDLREALEGLLNCSGHENCEHCKRAESLLSREGKS